MPEYSVWFDGKRKLPPMLAAVEKEYNGQIEKLQAEAKGFAKNSSF